MLDPIVESTRARVAEVQSRVAGARLPERPAASLIGALSRPGLGVVAEVKRRSPSAGDIAPTLDPVAVATAYSAGGAVGVSVLTEPVHFGGSMDDLVAVARAIDRPVLCKDFILDPAQVVAARLAGASAVLLITAILEDEDLTTLLEECDRVGVEALVEVHDELEVARAVDAGAGLIGVNNRDLATFEVDLGTAARLGPTIPAGIVTIAESGIRGPADAARMIEAGYDGILVGQAAASADDPAAFVRELAGAAR